MTEVLYIAGEGRSGSTILGSVLGEYPGFFHAGELRYIWTKGLAEDRLCGCRRKFSECGFWNQVVMRAFGGRDRVDAAAMYRGDHEISRLRRRPAASMFTAPPMDPERFAAYAGHLTRLYAAIQECAGARIIVDSSKSPYYLFALARIGALRLHVLHLVRDPRAVAFSRARKKRHPEAVGSTAMRESGAPRSARKWVQTNRAVKSLGEGLGPAYRVLRYEEFIAAPIPAIESIHALMGIPLPAERFKGGRRIELGENHTIWGNPNRFRRGPIELRLDEEWRVGMPWLKRVWVTLRTRKWLKAFGY
jgi:hypothetical protein